MGESNFDNLEIYNSTTDVSIGICGVGGGGGNAVKSMMESVNKKDDFSIAESDFNKIKFIAANTDAQALSLNPAPHKIQLGASLTKGFGAGGSPMIGEKSAIESKDEIVNLLAHNDLTFITCGMGGGTGTGAAPIIAQYLQEMRDEIVKKHGEHNEFANYLKVAVVTTPFHFEGQRKMQIAKKGIEEMKKYVDTMIVVPNQNLFRIANEKTTFRESFLKADEVLGNAIRCISGLITNAGLINVDFADVRYVLSKKGKAVIGMGSSSGGDDRAVDAALSAMSNPILDQVSFKKAKALLVSITGGDDLTLFEIDSALNRIKDEVDEDANIIFGSVYDPLKTGSITISVVATGIDDDEVKTESLSNEALLNNKAFNNNTRAFGMFSGGAASNPSGAGARDLSYMHNTQNAPKKDEVELNLNQKKEQDVYNKGQSRFDSGLSMNEKFQKDLGSSKESIFESNTYSDHSKQYNSGIGYGNSEKNNNLRGEKEIDLIMNEKLQKLGIYDDINKSLLNHPESFDNFSKNQNEKFSENTSVKFEENSNVKNNNYMRQQGAYSEHSNNKIFESSAGLGVTNEVPINNQDDKAKPQSGGIFSKFISDIPAYLRKRKDK